jgi:hypothetical protein
MNGYGPQALAAIDVELKEAVCDAAVNAVVARVSGTDDEGRFIYGRSPRRAIVSGQLLPRFDEQGEDDTSDIRIAALGVDFLLDSSATALLAAIPRFSVYVRVLPEWADVTPGTGPLDVEFRLKTSIHQQIEDEIRSRRLSAFAAAGIDRPDWKSMDEPTRRQVRERRARIQEEIRVAAYGERGILLNRADALAKAEVDSPESIQTADPDSPNTPDQPPAPPPPMARLLREGRQIPPQHLEPASIPQKWKRIALHLPAIGYPLHSSKPA